MKTACSNLVCIWLRSLNYDLEQVGCCRLRVRVVHCCDARPVQILASIDVEGNSKLTESLLMQLFTVIDEAQNNPAIGACEPRMCSATRV